MSSLLLTFILALVVFAFVMAGMGIRTLLQGKPMSGGCGNDPVVIDGEKLSCVGCPEEKKRECDLNDESKRENAA